MLKIVFICEKKTEGALSGGFYKFNNQDYLVKYDSEKSILSEFFCSIIARSILSEDNAPENVFIVGNNDKIGIASKLMQGLSHVNRGDVLYPGIEKVCLLEWLIIHGDTGYPDYNAKSNSNVVYLNTGHTKSISLIDYSQAFNKFFQAYPGLILSHNKISLKELNLELLKNAAREISDTNFHSMVDYSYDISIKYFSKSTVDAYYSNVLKVLNDKQQKLENNLQILDSNDALSIDEVVKLWNDIGLLSFEEIID